MHKRTAFLFLSIFHATLLASIANATPVPDVCSTLSEQTVRELMGVNTAQLVTVPSKVDPTHNSCVYYFKNGTTAIGVHGDSALYDPHDLYRHGDPYDPYSLVLDLYHLPTNQAAIEKMNELGFLVNSKNFTDSPLDTDQVDASRYDAVGESSAYIPSAIVVRHGSTVVALRLSSDHRPSTLAENRFQEIALTTAGAHVIPWPIEDLCKRIPAASVQTLVTRKSAEVVTETNASEGGSSTCLYVFWPDDTTFRMVGIQVKLTSHRHLNTAEALQALEKFKDDNTVTQSLVHTDNPHDRLFKPYNPLPAYTAGALHLAEIGEIGVYHPEIPDAQSTSYAYHLQQAALQAVGATILTAGAPPIPVPARHSTFLQIVRYISNLSETSLGVLIFISGFFIFLTAAALVTRYKNRTRRRKPLTNEDIRNSQYQ